MYGGRRRRRRLHLFQELMQRVDLAYRKNLQTNGDGEHHERDQQQGYGHETVRAPDRRSVIFA